MKSTAVAPSNIAFVKYWGKKDEVLKLPENGSISMNLSGMTTTTTVEFAPEYAEDMIEINGQVEENDHNRAIAHLDRVRNSAKIATYAKVVTVTNFPRSTGLSSSASGFAALTMAAVTAAGLQISQKEMSILARMGSGSACRSIPDGFTEWLDGITSDTSYAVSLYPPEYWDIADVVAVVSTAKKDISSTEGQKIKDTSPFFEARLKNINTTLTDAKKYLARRDFSAFGQLIEAEALNMHAIMMTSKPALLYLTPASLLLLKEVPVWRKAGLEVYFTVNTGQNVHLICYGKDVQAVSAKLKTLGIVKNIIVNHPDRGARLVTKDLF
jgi:diphosphomevalonate decarboxylase